MGASESQLSLFGERFAGRIGIQELMADLGSAMSGSGDVCMLGGGNPAHIPEVEARIRELVAGLSADPSELGRVLGDYDGPQGHPSFRAALADVLRESFGWSIGPGNIGLTLGSQNSFFCLFNMFAGPCADGVDRKVLFPLTPEYIGYADAGLSDDLFVSLPPVVEHLDDQMFKYHIDFAALESLENIGAICVSRPTNPSGNVLTDDEIHKLDALAQRWGVPLILDGAYGTPFPNIIFSDAEPFWNENTIVCMSLSKFGLPATRTGIVIASEEVIRVLAGFNAVCSLAPSSLGAAIAEPLLRSGEMLSLSRDVIQPFYREKALVAVEQLKAGLAGLDCHLHVPEGALFLWLWCRGLPIRSEVLYERLKARGVLVVSGHYFFPGRRDDTAHMHECIRITYSQAPEKVAQGLDVIIDEVRQAYKDG